METEPKRTHHHRKRRERAHPFRDKDESDGDSGDNLESSPPTGSKEKARMKPRKKRGAGAYEEDIIDGFAIVSFKSIEDLEKFSNGKLSNKKNMTPKTHCSLSPNRHKPHPNVRKKKERKPPTTPLKKHGNSAASSESSGETTDHLDTSDLILNGPQRPISRRFSDVSQSSSGRGYMCDSESGDERASDASSDIFTAAPINHTLKRDILIPSCVAVTTSSSTVATACSVTSSTSDSTVTTVTTTTSCVSLATTPKTTAATTITATPNINHNHSSGALDASRRPGQPVSSLPHRPTQPVSSTPHHPPPAPPLTRSPPSRQPKSHVSPSLIPNSIVHKNSQKVAPPLNKVIRREDPPRDRDIRDREHREREHRDREHRDREHREKEHRDREREKERDRDRERERDRDKDNYQALPPSLSLNKNLFGYGSHGSSTPTLYSPLGPSPGLPPPLPLHSSSTPSHTPAFAGAAGGSLHPHHPPTPHTPQTPQAAQAAHMFAPPLPLGGPAVPLTSTALGTPSPAHLPAESLSITSPDMLREELNRRFLASQQDRAALLQGMPPYLRTEMHQHMHQHQHQHTHQHTYHSGPPAPPPFSAASLVPTPAPHVYDKIPSSPFYRQNLPHRPLGNLSEPDSRNLPNGKDKIPAQAPRSSLPGLPGYPSPLLPAPGPLNSGVPGAFQPKNVSSLHPSQVMLPVREHDKSSSLPGTPHSMPGPKKSGKWCAVHVRIAWEIYHHQQKQTDPHKGPGDSKPVDPLRLPSHLMPGSTLPRPHDLPASAAASMLGSGRNPFDSSPHSLLAPGHIAPFTRPSPYSIGTSLPIGGIGNGLASTSREPPSSMPSAQDWNRLHRTPPTFPTPPSWSKPEDREREKELEREREHREREMERRREEERDRDRRMLDVRERHNSIDERGRERDRFRESELLAKSRSRSRSRSPMRNGRVDSVKSDSSYDRRVDIKVKEERREREDEMLSERERLLKSDFLTSNALRTDQYLQAHANMMDRSRMLTPAASFLGMGGDRVPPHPALWNPFDKGQMELQSHRLSLQREMEQTRDQFLTRFPHPQAAAAMGISMLEQERLKEEMMLQERARREYMERLPLYERERLYYENSKINALRPPDPLGVAHFQRTLSPAIGHAHLKRSSPAMLMPGAPPPLIHSVSATQTRGHNNSPAVNKTKGVSPTDSVGESKRDSNSNSTDPDAQSR